MKVFCRLVTENTAEEKILDMLQVSAQEIKFERPQTFTIETNLQRIDDILLAIRQTLALVPIYKRRMKHE